MNFFKNILKPKNETANNSGNTDWDSLRNMDAKQKEAKKRQMQENKATLALLYHNSNLLLQQQATPPTETERVELYRKIYNKEINTRQMRDLLLDIAPPAYTRNSSPEKVFDQLSDSYSANIFRYVNGLSNNPENPAQLDASIVKRTLALYPTPYEFEPVANEMINEVEQYGTSDDYNQYIGSMNDFKKNIYGKRQEYYYILKKITSQADHQEDIDKTKRRIAEQQNSPIDYHPPQADRGFYSPETQAIYYPDEDKN